MHKKISVGVLIAVIISTLIITAIITTAVTMNIYSGIVSELPDREAMYKSLAEVDDIVRNKYYGSVEEESIYRGISSGYADSLSVGVNSYMNSDEYASFKNSLSGINADGTSVSTVSCKKFGSSGYIKISGFCDNTPSQFSDAVKQLLDNGASSFVIDVRDTDSINIKCAAEIIDMIVPIASDGTEAIATAVDKNGSNIEIFSADSDSMDYYFSVLTNEKTVGAGELIACDLRDFGKATVVGQTTAGSGLYQKVYELSDGGAIILSIGKLLPYTSDCYDGIGVVPDFKVEPSEKTDDLNKDAQFLQAYASIQTIK